MKLKLAEILSKYTVPTCGYAPGIIQVFYSHGGLGYSKAVEIFGNCADYSMDGTGSGPSLFLQKREK